MTFDEEHLDVHGECSHEIAALRLEIERVIAELSAPQARNRELEGELHAANLDIKNVDEKLAAQAKDLAAAEARILELENALTLVMPMAKGYAAQHPVGSNQAIVNSADDKMAISWFVYPPNVRALEEHTAGKVRAFAEKVKNRIKEMKYGIYAPSDFDKEIDSILAGLKRGE